MGGIHSAGDMVLRMELNHKMRIGEAKKYVAGKLGITIEELCDSTFMADIRTDLGLGVQQPKIDDAVGVEAKNKISQVLDIKINSVEWMKKRSGLK
jgi:Dimethylamine methyltransferase (Dimeth_PyL)